MAIPAGYKELSEALLNRKVGLFLIHYKVFP
jgi:hypothetical protein